MSKTNRYFFLKQGDGYVVLDALTSRTMSSHETMEAARAEARRLNKGLDAPIVQRRRN